jgi:hypothetical protein
MPDSHSTRPERGVQAAFSWTRPAGCLLLVLAVALFYVWMAGVPDRRELGARMVDLRFDPVHATVEAGSPLRVAGAWSVSSDDPRFGGVSALAVDQGALLAITDRGALMRFPKPAAGMGRAIVRELPGGPRDGRFNAFRDAEAIVKDPIGRGWWIAFENVHELWLFDEPFRKALQRVELAAVGLRPNWGIEGLAGDGSDLLQFAEDGRHVVRITTHRQQLEPIEGSGEPLSDVAGLGSGRFIAIERRVTPLGFAHALVLLRKAPGEYATERRFRFGATPIDNFEAIAVDRSAGGTRLWLMTDDAFQRPFRTLLVAIDLQE